MKPTLLRLAAGLALVVALIIAGQTLAADLQVGPGELYTDIQSAVDAAASGDVIHIAAGTYVEQVIIVGKDLTLSGAGQGATVIESPAELEILYSTSFDHYPVVGIMDAEVALADLTIDGAGQGNDHVRFTGAEYHNAGGSVTDVTFLRVRNTPFSGAQHGVSLYLYNDDANARAFTAERVTVEDFQKNAMALNAVAGAPLALAVIDCEVTGAGPTNVTAQNGIQVSGPDIVATITGNTVRDIAWDGPQWTASGILLYDCTGTVSGNVIDHAQTALYASNASLTIDGNDLLIPSVQGIGTGIQLDNMTPGYSKAAGTFDARLAQPFGLEARRAQASRATVSAVITGNTLQLDPAIVDPAGTYGVFAYNYQSVDDLEVTIAQNVFTGLEIATIAADYAPTDGTFAAATYNGNQFNACVMGVYSSIPATVWAEDCWWGAPNGPGDVGSGDGAEVTLGVDFHPWVNDLTNLVYQPDPLNLNLASPEGEMVFDYTGGASGRIYGFSIDVIWDADVATAGAAHFTRPDSGPFADAQPFITQLITPGHARIDAALGGAQVGTYAASLFKAQFTAVPGVEGGVASLAVYVNTVRDLANNDLAGLMADLDSTPEILVDVVAPVVQDVVITDTTLPSTDWTRDTHSISVAATVIDGSVAALTCDLTAFGGTVQQLGDATSVGNVYTWFLPAASGMGNGPVTATVTCTDSQGQTAGLGDDIVADNTAPATLAGLAATPGFRKVHLLWDDPAADGGSPLQGVVLRAGAWGNYPHYTGPLPDGPADITGGLEVNADPLFGGTLDWAIAARDVYAITGFVVDLVGNVSSVGGTVHATNYWLGDTDDDGRVTVTPDVHALGETYGLSDGDPGYNGVCDVGPTIGNSNRGVPNPQIDGFEVQFEDLMIFALNFGTVTPSLQLMPGTSPDLAWERVDATTWALALLEPARGLKGINLAGQLPDGVSCQVTAGALLLAQQSPTFLQNIDAHGLDAGLAVLGQGLGLEGAGVLLRVVTSEPVDHLEVTVLVRDILNQDLPVDLPQATPVQDLPRVHNLFQNAPNPFNPATTIAFDLPRDQHVRLDIYSVDGRLVRRLVDDQTSAGHHQVTWRGLDEQGRRMATGAYFYVLEAGDFRQVRKMTLVK
jgi:hypothetical protein